MLFVHSFGLLMRTDCKRSPVEVNRWGCVVFLRWNQISLFVLFSAFFLLFLVIIEVTFHPALLPMLGLYGFSTRIEFELGFPAHV